MKPPTIRPVKTHSHAQTTPGQYIPRAYPRIYRGAASALIAKTGRSVTAIVNTRSSLRALHVGQERGERFLPKADDVALRASCNHACAAFPTRLRQPAKKTKRLCRRHRVARKSTSSPIDAR
jgi:hypothetical protein